MTQDLGGLLGGLLGGSQSGQSGQAGGLNLGAIISAALSMFMKNQGGNLNGLMSQLQAGGLGEQAQSWVGTGKNEPVTGEQVADALGQEKVQELATKAGVTPEQAADGLAQALPQVLDKLSPNGQLPDPQALQQQLSRLMNG
jgi:uncharacterized protein YidB (DUF937 family)